MYFELYDFKPIAERTRVKMIRIYLYIVIYVYKYMQFSPTSRITMNGHIRLNIILHGSKQLYIILDQIHDYA